jgi:PAS domain S-box-containing protein
MIAMKELVKEEIFRKWQSITDMLAEIIQIPSALIMFHEREFMEVLVSSMSEGNPYKSGDREEWFGLYCETVIQTQDELLVADALSDAHWCENPDLKLGMISYLGYPINNPDNTPFGTICVLDCKVNSYSESYKKLLKHFKDVIENDLKHLDKQVRKESFLENRFKLLFDNMTNGFALHKVITDDKGKPVDYIVTEVNPAYEKLTGLSAENVLNRRITEALPGIEKEWIEMAGNVAINGEPTSYEMYSNPLGKYFAISLFSPAEGYFASFFSEISEVKEAEKQLADKTQRLNDIIEGTNVGTWEWNVQTGETIFNERWADIIGYTLDELQPVSINTWVEYSHPEDLAQSNDLLKKHFDGDEDYYELECRMKHKKGHWIWVFDRGKVTKWDEDGKPLWMYGTHQEITSKKKARLEAIENEARLKEAQRLAKIGSWELDVVTGRLDWSDETYRIFNCTKDGFDNRYDSFLDFVHPADRKKVREVYQKHLQIKDPYEISHRIVLKNGDMKYVKEICTTDFDKDGNPVRSKGTVADITQQIEYERQLVEAKEMAEESDRLKTEFLNNMSHEIRTPMNGIIGFAELLSDTDVGEKEKAYYLRIVNNSARQLLHVIDDIIEISTLNTKQVEASKSEFSLNTMLMELFSIFNLKAQEKKLPMYLRKGAPDNACLIRSDNLKLIKILSNLIENALKYTSAGHIEVGYTITGNDVQIFVKDTGIGIDPKNHEMIFSRFTQENSGLARSYGGLGLGLSIAKENAEIIGGELTLESTKGNGATFFVTLPNAYMKEGDSVIHSQEGVGDVGVELNVLVAEDEEVNYLYLETIINSVEGVDVKLFRAINGLEAVELIHSDIVFDLVFMDIKMPVMNGHEATRLIKETCPEVVVIAQTAYSTESDMKRAIESGCDRFMTKPIKRRTLMDVILEFASKKKAQE